jgi:hypothetical protein
VPGRQQAEETTTYFRIATPDYFATMGIRLRDGRTFDRTDRRFTAADTGDGLEMAIVVNEALARKYFAGENPVGRVLGGGFGARQRIVGVVADVAEARLTDAREPVRYFLAGQAPWFGNTATLVLRTTRADDAERVLDAARATIARVAPGYAVQGTTTMQRVLDAAVGPARQIMVLLTLLSALALVLGAVGIYGVIAHFAARRRRDWAVRVALGLRPSRVVAAVVGQGAALVGVGVAVGVVGTVALARLLASFLFGVGTIDPLAFAAAAGALLLVGLVAAFVPAWRTGATNPAVVLREQ